MEVVANTEMSSSKLPSLLDISPYQISPPEEQNFSTESIVKSNGKNVTRSNRNIPSLLSLDVAPENQTEPVSLLSLNIKPPSHPLAASASATNQGISMIGKVSGGPLRNVRGIRGHTRIPSLFESDMTSAIPSQNSLLVTPPLPQRLKPEFSHSVRRTSNPPQEPIFSAIHPSQPTTIPSLMAFDLSWMRPQEIVAVPRTSVRDRRTYCFNCYGHGHTSAKCHLFKL